MKLKAYLPMLAASLLVAGCGGLRLEMGIAVGDFCDLNRPLSYTSDDVADYLAKNDPMHVERDSAVNIYGERHCNWKF